MPVATMPAMLGQIRLATLAIALLLAAACQGPGTPSEQVAPESEPVAPEAAGVAAEEALTASPAQDGLFEPEPDKTKPDSEELAPGTRSPHGGFEIPEPDQQGQQPRGEGAGPGDPHGARGPIAVDDSSPRHREPINVSGATVNTEGRPIAETESPEESITPDSVLEVKAPREAHHARDESASAVSDAVGLAPPKSDSPSATTDSVVEPAVPDLENPGSLTSKGANPKPVGGVKSLGRVGDGVASQADSRRPEPGKGFGAWPFVLIGCVALALGRAPTIIWNRRVRQRAHRDYIEARGTQHRLMIEQCLSSLSKEKGQTDVRLKTLRSELRRLGGEKDDELKQALTRHLVQGELRDIAGIGEALGAR